MRKRAQAQFLCSSFQVSERRACRVLKLERSVYYYRSRKDPQTELRVRLKDLAAARVRYGYERLHTLLRREGWQINLKRVYRLFHEEGLSTAEDEEEAHQRTTRAALAARCAE